MYKYKVSLKQILKHHNPLFKFSWSANLTLILSKNRYAYGKFSNSHEATIGGCFLTKNEDLGDYIVKYEMWDTAG